ncbi:MAG: hypothetical protein GY926_02195 [bacterium]|nr:hypothetical protein [bacterium]
MERQMLLHLAYSDQEVLRRLWEQIPEENRKELTERVARLIAQAAREISPPQQEESNHEVGNQ